MLFLTLHVCLKMGWSPQFNFHVLFISLKLLMLLKGCSGLLVFGAAIKNANVLAFLSEFGCQPSCKKLNDKKTTDDDKKVYVNGDFLCFNVFTKIVDLVIGAAVWIGVIWVMRLGQWSSEPKSVRVVLGAITALQFFTDILVVILALSVYW